MRSVTIALGISSTLLCAMFAFYMALSFAVAAVELALSGKPAIYTVEGLK